MIFRSFKYKLSPTLAQEELFRQFSGVCRLIYNIGLEQRRDHWRRYHQSMGRHINYFGQAAELTMLRQQYDWIGAVPRVCQQIALQDLDLAYKRFFEGISDYPTHRKKGTNESFRFDGRNIKIKSFNAKWGSVFIPKIGWIKFRDTRATRGLIKTATIALDSLGWHIVFGCKIEHEIPINISMAVGIDRGVTNTLTLSNGERLSVPVTLASLDRRYRKLQKLCGRKKRGSQRYAKALRRCAKLSSRRARVRRDWHHKATLNIAQRFGTVILEDLNISNMTASAKGTISKPGRGIRKKAGLNRSILNQGWFIFETILAYKLHERGGQLLKVNAAYTSQTCSECGTIDKLSRESQAAFVCRHCGFEIHADHNAAINILRRSTASMRMEDERRLAREVRTKSGRKFVKNPMASAVGGY